MNDTLGKSSLRDSTVPWCVGIGVAALLAAFWADGRVATAQAGGAVVRAPAPVAQLDQGARLKLRREIGAAAESLGAALLARGLEWTIYMDMAPRPGAALSEPVAAPQGPPGRGQPGGPVGPPPAGVEGAPRPEGKTRARIPDAR